MHPSFKINNNSFAATSFLKYIDGLIVEEELYLQEIGLFLKEWINEEEYVTVRTSGSTGVPKEIQLSKQHMINSALATGAYFNIKDNTTALLCLSANYIAGKMMLVRAIVLGWDIHLVSPKLNPLQGIEESYDFCAMVPLQVEESIAELSKVKKLIIGGGVVSPILNQHLQSVNTDCFATYGMTETITHIAVKKINNFIDSDSNAKSLYQILSNITISQDDRDCLVIEASSVSNDIIVTNDIVKLHSSTEFEWLGRYDNVINSGGIKLFPEQIEEKLSQLIKNRFFVIGILDDKLGEKLILIIESDFEFIISKSDYKACNLNKFEVPKQIFTLPSFIETLTGKVQRKKTLALV